MMAILRAMAVPPQFLISDRTLVLVVCANRFYEVEIGGKVSLYHRSVPIPIFSKFLRETRVGDPR